MAHIVLVVGEYYPYFSAVGVCCRNIAEAIKAEDNTVTVVCMKSRAGETAIDDYRGQRIIRTSTHLWTMRLRLEEQIRNAAASERGGLDSALKVLLTLLLDCLRLAGAVRSLMSRTSINGADVGAFLAALFTRVDEPIDMLVPFCFPMEAVVACMKYKDSRPATRLVPYLFDPFVDSRTMHRTMWNMRIKRRRHMDIEAQMMARASRVFCLDHIGKHLEQHGEVSQRIVRTEHPLLRKNEGATSLRSHGDGIVRVAYAGLFDGRVRNPEYFLRLMLKALPKLNGSLDLYASGNCGKVIDAYCARSSGRILSRGYLPKREVDDALVSCDVLVSVGNVGTSQSSSKLIEYASTGKPIIHFFSVEDDPGEALLRRYPLSLCVREDDRLLDENTEVVVDFCRREAGRVLDFGEVGRIFIEARPDVIARKLLDVMT